MDWVLSITTLLTNSGLGWTKGKWWMWIIHSINSILWITYSLVTEQYGLILLSLATITIDLISARREYKTTTRKKDARTN